MTEARKHFVVGVTGASGTIYAVTLLQELLFRGHDVDLVFSAPGRLVAASELFWELPKDPKMSAAYVLERLSADRPEEDRLIGYLTVYDESDLASAPASGSYLVDAMIIVPASMGAVSAVAQGRSDNLLERVADVTLKEGRKLVVVPREAPMNVIHLKNLLALAEMGVTIVPACPSFYQMPKTIDDLVRYFVLRLLDQLGIHINSNEDSRRRWRQ
jgi:4-hydroxy-3-polyprenylbenzoate decarboxylase